VLTLNNNHTARGARAKGDLVLPISCRCLGELALLPGISRRRLGGISCHRLGELMPPALGDSGGPSTAAIARSQTPPQGAWGPRIRPSAVEARHEAMEDREKRQHVDAVPVPLPGVGADPRLSLSQGRLMVAALPALGRAPPPAAEI
jgi:hypothetical protein